MTAAVKLLDAMECNEHTVATLPNGPWSRLRSRLQALADLVAKHKALHYPERRDPARMITQLEAEVTWRTAQRAAG